jgi:hypothetical protein
MNSAPGLPSDTGTDVGTDVGIVVGTDVGLVVGIVVGSDVGVVVPGVGVTVMSVVSFTVSFVRVVAGVGLAESELMHPLSKTMPLTRTMKILIAYQFFNFSDLKIPGNMIYTPSRTYLS